MINYLKQYLQKKKIKNKIYLYASGSTGSVFFHSLISNHKKILSIPIILDTERVYRHFLKTNKSLKYITNSPAFANFNKNELLGKVVFITKKVLKFL